MLEKTGTPTSLGKPALTSFPRAAPSHPDAANILPCQDPALEFLGRPAPSREIPGESEMDAWQTQGLLAGQTASIPGSSAQHRAHPPQNGARCSPRPRRSLRNWGSTWPRSCSCPSSSLLMVGWFVGCFVVKNPRAQSQVLVLPFITSVLGQEGSLFGEALTCGNLLQMGFALTLTLILYFI